MRMRGNIVARRYIRIGLPAAPFALTWLVIIVGGVGGKHVAQVVSNGGLAATAIAAAISCVFTGWRARGRYRLVWVLLGLGMLSWGVGQLIWDYYEAVLHRNVPFPSLADAGYLGEVPLVVAALMLLPSGTRSLAGRSRTILDGLIVASALLLVSWMLVLGTVFHSGSGSVLTQTLSLAYPISDVVTVTIVMYAILRARQTGRKVPVPLLLVGLGLVSLSVADSGFTYQTAIGTYFSGAPIDTGWFAGFLLILLAARAPGAAKVEEDVDDVQRSMGLLLPYVAVVLATVTTFVELGRGSHFGPFVGWDRSLLISLLVARQVLTMRENVALNRSLEARVIEVRASEQRFEALVQHSSDVVTVMDDDGVVIYQSESVHRVYGHQSGDVRGHRFAEFLADDDAVNRLHAAVEQTRDNPDDIVVIEVRLQHADGHIGETEVAITNLLGDSTVGGVVLNSRDISERKALEHELVHQAHHDSLTALANRALFQDRVNDALQRDEPEVSKGAVLFLDLDGFKEINDSFGHANGDILLTLVAHRLRTCVRPADTVARLGGDEFAILIEDSAGQADAQALATRVLTALAAPFIIDGRDVYITASIGIASADEMVEEADQLLRNADLAMYRAKSTGGGSIEHYDPALHAQLIERMQFEDDLRRALGRGELRLFYQPIMDLATGQPVGFEALVRWMHPTAGLVMPNVFIPIAERTGLIQPIGRWVLHEACRDAMIWRQRHPEYAELGVSVNLSARQFQNDDLVDDVRNALAETGLPASSLELEMTESVLFEHTDQNIAQLSQLKEIGVKLAIDDFGTGYSSLAYLHRFSVDVLKIDRTFIAQLTDTGDTELVRSILQIGQSLRMVTIAEGIETHEQSALVTEMGCELGQGYLFARPLPASDVDGWLTATHLPASRAAG